ncbi:MAG: MarR family winged helix-turn-helix transcriptional regulator [Nocardioides sp.]|uniref:MarR family winged helix-turn-helix transcriptional regulator n=1 Tax=Nocardioides sp. TaxID=35761 RepID=UPI003EFCC55E
MPEPTDDVRWLTADEHTAWLATAALMIRLPAALDSQLVRDSGLTFFEYMVLVALSEAEDRTLQMSVLAEMASSSLSRLSHAASRLEDQGLLTRCRVPGAGRRTAATLTDTGYAAVAAAAPGHVRRVRDLLIDRLSPDDLAALGRAGRAVMEALGEGDCREQQI